MWAGPFHFIIMSSIIYPRSPRETMDGWSYLPRYLDKIRLHLAGKLHADYQENFGKGFDGLWLKYAGVTHEQMIEVVKNSITDGEVCDWVRRNVKKSPAEKAAHAKDMLSRPPVGDAEADCPAEDAQGTIRHGPPRRHQDVCGLHRRRRKADLGPGS